MYSAYCANSTAESIGSAVVPEEGRVTIESVLLSIASATPNPMKESVTSPKKSSTSGKATPLATAHTVPQKIRNQSQAVANRNCVNQGEKTMRKYE